MTNKELRVYIKSRIKTVGELVSKLKGGKNG